MYSLHTVCGGGRTDTYMDTYTNARTYMYTHTHYQSIFLKPYFHFPISSPLFISNYLCLPLSILLSIPHSIYLPLYLSFTQSIFLSLSLSLSWNTHTLQLLIHDQLQHWTVLSCGKSYCGYCVERRSAESQPVGSCSQYCLFKLLSLARFTPNFSLTQLETLVSIG